MDQLTLEAISPLIDRYCDELGRFTVSFFKRNGSAVEQFGSGVLLRVADAHFVATARHVIDEALPQETWPFMEASPVSIGVGPIKTVRGQTETVRGQTVRGQTVRDRAGSDRVSS